MTNNRSRSLVPAQGNFNDIDLLKTISGSVLSEKMQSLYIVGAHRLDEKTLLDIIFPNLKFICVFEPLEGPRATLLTMAGQDRRMKILPFAISDFDGVSEFKISTNDGESSSLLSFGTHQQMFPHVGVERTQQVEVRRLATVIKEYDIPPPDCMIVDVQGAEYSVLAGLETENLNLVRLIYTEVSTEPVYEGGRLLADIEFFLRDRFENVGFASLMPSTPTHGNVIFVNKSDTGRLFRKSLTFRAKQHYWHLRQVIRKFLA